MASETTGGPHEARPARGPSTLALALLAAPVAAGTQQPGKPARIGILYGASPAFRPDTDPADRAFVTGLGAHGYVVGQNVVIEFRSALGGTVDRFPPLAAELVRLGVDVVTIPPAVRAAREASPTIPIVMAGASVDPVGEGLVTSLARPGGNITGVTQGDLAGKLGEHRTGRSRERPGVRPRAAARSLRDLSA